MIAPTASTMVATDIRLPVSVSITRMFGLLAGTMPTRTYVDFIA